MMKKQKNRLNFPPNARSQSRPSGWQVEEFFSCNGSWTKLPTLSWTHWVGSKRSPTQFYEASQLVEIPNALKTQPSFLLTKADFFLADKICFLLDSDPDQRKFLINFSIALHTLMGRGRTTEMWIGMLASTCFTKTSLLEKEIFGLPTRLLFPHGSKKRDEVRFTGTTTEKGCS